jgi:hypothetical protein
MHKGQGCGGKETEQARCGWVNVIGGAHSIDTYDRQFAISSIGIDGLDFLGEGGLRPVEAGKQGCDVTQEKGKAADTREAERGRGQGEWKGKNKEDR